MLRFLLALLLIFALAAPALAQSSQKDDVATNKSSSSSSPPDSSSLSAPMPAPLQQGSDFQSGGYDVAKPGANVQPFDHPSKIAPPAWAQPPMAHPFDPARGLEPFGVNLFNGSFSVSYYSGLDDTYKVMPGDRVAVRIWGAKTFDEILPVDQQGNLFLPEIGPVMVGGLTQDQLLAVVKKKVATVFTSNVDIYVNLMNAQPVAVYVTGFVKSPGRYSGGPTDSAMYFLDSAGGVDPVHGSYRDIRVTRGQETIAYIDLYEFILNGRLPEFRLQSGDTIVVGKRGPSVAAMGRLRQPAYYELARGKKGHSGADLIRLATPLNSVSHVSVSGVRSTAPYNEYMTLEEFRRLSLVDNDQVEFHSDRRSDSIMVAVNGAAGGGSRFTLRNGSTLADFLRYIPVDTELADFEAVYVRRLSVAAQQKQSILDALRRLEQSTLTATSSSVEEAEIRVREAELVQNFVARAAEVNPNGVVVVSRKGKIQDLVLEDGDTVVIPARSNVVLISGEVMMPNSVVYAKELKLKEYVLGAGGFTDRADPNNILVIKPNGAVGQAKSLGVGPGDRLMVMPSYDTKNMQNVKDIAQIIYQIAVATGVLIGL